MAPVKRKGDDEPVKQNTTSSRVTRSSTRGVAVGKSTTESAVPSDIPKKKKAKTGSNKKAEDAKAKAEPPPPTKVENVNFSKTIVIEHCKQCHQFKTRAIQVKNGLETDVSGINVLVNPEKPRRGCFEIREEGGEKFISLLDMKRPFAPMRALDMDKVISDIIDKIK